MTDTEKDALCVRIDELCAELGHAQLNRDMWHDRAEDMSNRLLAAHAENAKLRELVRLMVRRHTPISPCKNIPCGECPVKDECDQEDALMHELGVGVDE